MQQPLNIPPDSNANFLENATVKEFRKSASRLFNEVVCGVFGATFLPTLYDNELLLLCVLMLKTIKR